MDSDELNVSLLKGQTLVECQKHRGYVEEWNSRENDQIIFKTDAGKTYRLAHEQSCCETVEIESIVGDLSDLVGSPITLAEQSSKSDRSKRDKCETHTWTFYKFATVKGYVDIRWHGQSNGYYSERVSFVEVG